MNATFRLVHEDWAGQPPVVRGTTGRGVEITAELAPGCPVKVTAWEPLHGGPLRLILAADAPLSLDGLQAVLHAAGVPDVTLRQAALFPGGG